MNRRWLISFITLFISSNVYCVCKWNINKDLPKKSPIYLSKTGQRYQLYYPDFTNITLNAGQTLVASCNGHSNYVTVSRNEHAEVNITCSSKTNVDVEGVQHSVKDVECSQDVTATIRKNVQTCANQRGKQLSVGFLTASGWMELYRICYNYADNIPFYAQHMLHGKALNGSYTGKDKYGFKTTGLATNISWNQIYKHKHQCEIFEHQLGTHSSSFCQDTEHSLDRGHLAPNADFIFNTMQMATYFYANVVPQFKFINRGIWVRIEHAVRRVAKSLKEDLKVITGVYETLKLNNNSNKETDVYLAKGNNVPVPKYMWKVVCDKHNKCISIVVYNNPFAKAIDSLCKDICKTSKWFNVFKNDASKGLVVCCDLEEFKKIVEYVPVDKVTGILDYHW